MKSNETILIKESTSFARGLVDNVEAGIKTTVDKTEKQETIMILRNDTTCYIRYEMD